MIFPGWIALDIDGTITLDKYSVPEEVTCFLRSLSKKGWKLALVTGRPFAFASMALSQFDFPYLFILQNGSLALEMPAEKVLCKQYLNPSLLIEVEKAYEGYEGDFLVYAGYEKGDFCYWRPSRHAQSALPYLEDLQKRQKERWQAVENFAVIQEPFPLIKCFGPSQQMKRIAERLRKTNRFEVAFIRDPHAENTALLLVTDLSASKGVALQKIFDLQGRGSLVIAAGDDENDLSLLEVADIGIAMAHAPQTLQSRADLIAPPTEKEGIISALQKVIHDAGY